MTAPAQAVGVIDTSATRIVRFGNGSRERAQLITQRCRLEHLGFALMRQQPAQKRVHLVDGEHAHSRAIDAPRLEAAVAVAFRPEAQREAEPDVYRQRLVLFLAQLPRLPPYVVAQPEPGRNFVVRSVG